MQNLSLFQAIFNRNLPRIPQRINQDFSSEQEYFDHLMSNKPIGNPLSPILLKALFETSEYKEQAQKLFSHVKNSKPVCGKIFGPTDIGFKCRDCEKDPSCILCKECFEKMDHKGHQVTMSKHVSGCCDCGDPDAWKKNGNCSDHPGYANFKPTYSLNDITNEIQEKFCSILEDSLHKFFLLCEEHATNKKISMEACDFWLTEILDLIEFCVEKSYAFYLLICKSFKLRLTDCKRKLRIKSNELKNLLFNQDADYCDLSYLECLFRFSRFTNPPTQKKLCDLKIKLFLDYDFKVYIAHTYLKMIHSIVYQDEQGNFTMSDLGDLRYQLFTAAEFTIIGMDTPYFLEFIDFQVDILENLVKTASQGVYSVYARYLNYFQTVAVNKVSRQYFMKNHEFVLKFLRVLSKLDYCHKVEANDKLDATPHGIEAKVYLIETELRVNDLVNMLFTDVLSLPTECGTEKLLELVGKYFLGYFREKSQEFEKKINDRSVIMPSYRAFGIILKCLMDGPSAKNLRNAVYEKLKLSKEESKEVFAHVFENSVKTYGFIQDCDKKLIDKFRAFDMWSNIYKNTRFRFIDIDIFFMQASLLFIDSTKVVGIISEFYSTNFLMKSFFKLATGEIKEEAINEVLGKVKTPKFYEMISIAIDSFFLFVITIMTDRTSLSNLYFQDEQEIKALDSQIKYATIAYEDVLINYMQKNYRQDFKTILKTLSARSIRNESNIEPALLKIATFNTENKLFTLKEEYYNIYEPYCLVKDQKMQYEINEAISIKLKKSEETKKIFDMIVGNNSNLYKFEDSITTDVIEKISLTSILRFGLKLLDIKFVSTPIFTRSILKIFHIILAYFQQYPDETRLLSLEDLLNESKIFEKLEKLLQDPTFEDIHVGIEKIIDLHKKLKSLDPSSMAPIEIKREKSNNNSKELAKKRMEEIKKKFSNMQQTFLKKNASEIQEESKGTEDSEDCICNYCHSKIDLAKEEYGIPAYFSKSSIYSLAQKQTLKKTKMQLGNIKSFKVKSESILEEEEPELNPKITSCNHLSHRACFLKNGRARSDKSDPEFFYNNELEYMCNFCKSLSNTYVILPNTTDKKDDVMGKEKKPIEKLLNNLELPKPSGTSKNLEIYNDIVFIEILEQEDKAEVPEGYLASMLDNIVKSSIDGMEFSGINEFLKKDLKVIKATKTSFEHYYKGEEFSLREPLFNLSKYCVQTFIEMTKSSGFISIRDLGLKMMFGNQGMPIPLHCNPDQFLLKCLQTLLISSPLDENDSKNLIEDIFARYICHKLVQIYVKRKVLKEEFDSLNKENFFTTLSLDNDSMIKQEFMISLLPTLKKLFCFYLINSTQEITVSNEFNSDQEEFEYYLKKILPDITSQSLLSLKAFEEIGITKDVLAFWISTLRLDLVHEKEIILGESILLSDQELKFSFPNLPGNFLELTTKYMYMNCELCNNHSEVGSKTLCMLCEKFLCCSRCHKNQTFEKLGNLNKHSLKAHGGLGIYLNIEDGSLALINSPKNVIFGSIYIDKFGYEVNKRNQDWKDLGLDKRALDKLRVKLVTERVPQEIVYSILKNNKKITEGAF